MGYFIDIFINQYFVFRIFANRFLCLSFSFALHAIQNQITSKGFSGKKKHYTQVSIDRAYCGNDNQRPMDSDCKINI